MKPSPLALVLAALLVIPGSTPLIAHESGFQSDEAGIVLTVGEQRVELQVASAHAFRLGIHDPATANPVRSIYLDPAKEKLPPFTVVHEDQIVGIQTAFGRLLVDPNRRMWSLRNADGIPLSDWATLGKAAPDENHHEWYALSIGSAPEEKEPSCYGSGSNPNRGALTQVKGESNTGNGTAMLPQYWSTVRYGVLAIGSNDDAPASWTATPTGQVDWKVPGHGIDLYLCPAASLYEWVRDQAELTGFAPVPPRWAFGYLQSRWGWTDKAYIDEVLARFHRDQLPVDAFIIDFEWYTVRPDYSVQSPGEPDYVDFNWNGALFPHPEEQIAEMARQGLHLIGIRKPRLGNSESLKMAREKHWMLPDNPLAKEPPKTPTRDLDFSQPDVRAWWGENNRKFVSAGMAGFWNDEGESDYVEYMYWNLAETALQQSVKPGTRFWSLNRSFTPGMQRLGATVWTGDIDADWKTLARTPGEMLSYGLSGMPYSTCDIGGFAGVPSPELLTRWMQAGVFFPMMRSHSEIGRTPRFPWLFGEAAEAAIHQALDLRYRLIQYAYSLAHENSTTGAPVMRALAMEFPADPQAARLTDEWLLGKSLLAAPLLHEGGRRDVYLPADRWYRFGTTEAVAGPLTVTVDAALDDIPVYVRAGSLLPLGPLIQHTGEAVKAPLEMQIYPGRDATFDFVEDDGESQPDAGHPQRTTRFHWDDAARQLTWTASGGYHGDNVFRAVKAVLFSPSGRRARQGTLEANGEVRFDE